MLSMARRADDERSITRSRVCEIGGVNRQTRDKWAARGLLLNRDRCGELDLVELVVLSTINRTIRKGHVPIAWNQVRAKLREGLPTSGLTLVWDVQARKAEFARDERAIVDLVRHGRPVHVIDLAAPIDAARRAFRNELAASQVGQPEQVRSRQSAERLRGA
jgi:hypothetical protein